MLQVLVGRDKDIEVGLDKPEQFAILYTRPAHFLDCEDRMCRQPLFNYAGDAFVEDDPSWSQADRLDRMAEMLKDGYRLFAGDGWEVFEELVEGEAGL